MTAVSGSGCRIMSDSWISWNPRIDEPSNPNPSSKVSSVSWLTGTEKCCMRPGRSQKRRSTISTPSSCASCTTSAGVRSSTVASSVCTPAGRYATSAADTASGAP